MKAVSPRVNINKTRLLVDAGTLASSLVATAPRFSGLSIHEWMSIGLAVVNVVRLLLNWSWITSITRRLLGKTLAWKQRLGYALNALPFIDFAPIVFTRLAIPEVTLPQPGAQISLARAGKSIHRFRPSPQPLSRWEMGFGISRACVLRLGVPSAFSRRERVAR